MDASFVCDPPVYQGGLYVCIAINFVAIAPAILLAELIEGEFAHGYAKVPCLADITDRICQGHDQSEDHEDHEKDGKDIRELVASEP